jgi:CheY-like chemotaxis protein
MAIEKLRRIQGMQVLLLDDDPFMLELLAEMIEELGPHTVHQETEGRRALQTLQTLQPDLLICDLSMPAMDGIDFLRFAAAQQFAGSVVLLSGVDGGVLRAAQQLAVVQGLTVLCACPKPLSHERLSAVLASAEARLAGGAG